MRTFVSATLLAFAFAQEESTAAETAEETWSSVKNWFAATTTEYLTLEQQKQPFGSYAEENHHMLNATISLDSTAVGANFVTVAMDLSSSNPAHFAANSYTSMYFQIEQPVAEEEGAHMRLLQDEPAAEEEEVVTGTGNYEGWLAILKAPTTAGEVSYARNKNLWGTVVLAEVTTGFGTFADA